MYLAKQTGLVKELSEQRWSGCTAPTAKQKLLFYTLLTLEGYSAANACDKQLTAAVQQAKTAQAQSFSAAEAEPGDP